MSKDQINSSDCNYGRCVKYMTECLDVFNFLLKTSMKWPDLDLVTSVGWAAALERTITCPSQLLSACQMVRVDTCPKKVHPLYGCLCTCAKCNFLKKILTHWHLDAHREGDNRFREAVWSQLSNPKISRSIPARVCTKSSV